MFGDKVNARIQAKLAGIPMIPGSDGPLNNFEELEEFAKTHGFPLMIKAVNGGGGRGMRAVESMGELREAMIAPNPKRKWPLAMMMYMLKN